MRNEQQIPNVPRHDVVVHEIEVRRLVRPNRVHHRRIRAVADGIANARLLAFELIWLAAARTNKVTSLCVVALSSEFRERTIRTIKILLSPSFRDDARTLRTARVILSEFRGHL